MASAPSIVNIEKLLNNALEIPTKPGFVKVDLDALRQLFVELIRAHVEGGLEGAPNSNSTLRVSY